MKKAEDRPILVETAERLPEGARTNGAGVRKRSAGTGGGSKKAGATASKEPAATKGKPSKSGRAAANAEPAAAKEKLPKADRTGVEATTPKKTTKAGRAKEPTAKRAKAKKPNEKITPASIFKKLMAFGKVYQIENEQDFMEAARIYAEEAGLIDQMRDRLAEDGLTVMKTYKTGDVEVAHPLLSELPRHVESANRCLMTISGMIEDRGAKKEGAKRDLDAFRLHR